jgi:hypothetical protein
MAAGSEFDLCGEPGSRGGACGLVPGHEGNHFPVRVCELNPPPAVRRHEPGGYDDGWERGRDAYHVTFPRTAESDREAC